MYEFRKLNSTDIFKMVRVIKNLNIKQVVNCFDAEEVSQMVSKQKEQGKKKEEIEINVGMDVVFKIADLLLCNIEKCETDLYELLSSCSNLSVKQIKEMDINLFLQMIIDFIQKEELKDFMKVALKLIK